MRIVSSTVQIRENCSSNLKMAGSGIAECPEIEQIRKCQYFGSGICPSCYSEFLYRLREGGRRWREERGIHSHRTTANRGIIRLGTYIEVSPSPWLQYKQGKGTWDCCGQTWSRPDFRTRQYFLVTRGLYSEEFYQQVLSDPALLTLHVSVDITDRVIPRR